MISVRNVTLRCGANVVLDRASVSSNPGEKIGLVACNVAGKSSFFAPLNGALHEDSGDGMRMAHACIALHDAGAHNAPARPQALILGLAFSAPQLSQPVFSGGWRMRLQLARALMCPADWLLDEPTNHLDLTTREVPGMVINEFGGVAMLVSHDRALLRAARDKFGLVTKGSVEPFVGDLDDSSSACATKPGACASMPAADQEVIA